ncbi:hypothetical protein QNM99_21240 [Pseudomonas sp. PCH446]
MDQAAQFYLEQMGKQLTVIAQRYGVPADQLDQHINQIPAISLAPPADHSVSLYQALHAAPLAKLPAYIALNARLHLAGAPMTEHQVRGSIRSRGRPAKSSSPSSPVAGGRCGRDSGRAGRRSDDFPGSGGFSRGRPRA